MHPCDGFPSSPKGPYLVCPTCRGEYSHIQEVFTRIGSDPCEAEAKVYPGTQGKGQSQDRRSALVVVVEGECNHTWELILQQSKGLLYLQHLESPLPQATPQKISRAFMFTGPDIWSDFTEWSLHKIPLPMRDDVALVIDVQAQAFEAGWRHGWRAAMLRATYPRDAFDI